MFDKEAYYYDIFHIDKNYRKEAKEIKKSFPNAKTILEIGSGTGLMTKELIKLGYKVTTIEPSKEMVNIAITNGIKTKHCLTTIQKFNIKKKYDLVLALYDVLNYVSFSEIDRVLRKIAMVGRSYVLEKWNNRLVYPITYKKVLNCHRMRLGFKLFKRVYLWYIYWGRGLCIEFHKLYIHD